MSASLPVRVALASARAARPGRVGAKIESMLRRAIASRRAWAGCAALALTALALASAGPAAGAARPASAAGDLALALRFRPRLLFDAKERWRPVDVDRFLAEPGHQACPPASVPPAPCVRFTSVAQLTPSVAYLDMHGTHEDGSDAVPPDLATCAKTLPSLRECDGGGRSVIYAHVVRRGARVALDYWWFLRYNAYSLDRHESDWEGVTVIVNRAATRVLEVHFAAHADAWRYDADVPSVVGGRVKVYVSNGDHAAYPRACTHLCRQTDATLPESHFGGERSWIGNSAAGCRRRCVRLLPSGPNGAPASWDAWDGRWGAPTSPAFAPPETPAFQRRFRDPFAATRSHRHLFRIV
jgi:hypothetical protein